MKKLSLIFGAFLVLALPSIAWAETVTIRFDELSTRPVSGVSLMGVTFGYTGPTGATATFNTLMPFGPPALTHLQCPCLEGDARGTLTLDFAAPTSSLSFGLARSTSISLTPAATVALFDAGLNPIGSFPVDTGPLSPFFVSENLFSMSGPLIGRAVITFSFPTDVTRFAMDNLTFDGGGAAVPEPVTMFLLGTGLAGVGAAVRRRRRTSRSNK